ncbi:hypothetical protein [Nocardia sp. CA-135398]|uniref:hypothetical protein n=1 Tax=Nocardia sp. CA-135398 TaxID=3239977 RepID=UPI003D981E53
MHTAVTMGELLFDADVSPIPLHDPARLDLVTCTTPLIPGPLPQAMIDEIRAEMRALGPVIPVPYHPLSDRLRLATRVIRDGLERYVETDAVRADRLYVLDFQGPGEWQYIMFGHTTRGMERINEHIRAAEPHGWVLLDGWISPGTERAQELEQVALTAAEGFHGCMLGRSERFYGMDFQLGLKIARTVFELNSNLPPCAH